MINKKKIKIWNKMFKYLYIDKVLYYSEPSCNDDYILTILF